MISVSTSGKKESPSLFSRVITTRTVWSLAEHFHLLDPVLSSSVETMAKLMFGISQIRAIKKLSPIQLLLVAFQVLDSITINPIPSYFFNSGCWWLRRYASYHWITLQSLQTKLNWKRKHARILGSRGNHLI